MEMIERRGGGFAMEKRERREGGFGDTPLKDSGSTSFVQFTLMHFKGFRAMNYASGFALIVGKLLPIKVGLEWFGPGSDNRHDLMSRGCYLNIRTPDNVWIVFGNWGCDQVCIAFSALTLPHYGWLKESFHKGVRWHRVALSSHTSEDVGCLITFSSNVMKLKSFEPS